STAEVQQLIDTALQGIHSGLSTAEVQQLINAALQDIQDKLEKLSGQDTTDDGRIKDALNQITALRDRLDHTPIGSGLTKAEVETVVKGLLLTIQSDIAGLSAQDGTDKVLIQNLVNDVKALQANNQGDLTEAKVKEWIEHALLVIQSDIAGLSAQDQTDNVLIQNLVNDIKALHDKDKTLDDCCQDGRDKLHELDEAVQQIRHDLAQGDQRRSLGTGIVTGLEIRRDSNQNVVVYPGEGLTTDGKRLSIDHKRTLFFGRELDPAAEKPLFDYFQDLRSEDTRKIWEISDDPALEGHGGFTLHPRRPEDRRPPAFLDDKVVVLYGDTAGKTRFLLLRRTDVAKTIFPAGLDFQRIRQENDARPAFDIWHKSQPAPKDGGDPTVGVPDYELYNALQPLMEIPVLALRRFGYGQLDVAELPCDEQYLPVFCQGNSFNSFGQIVAEYKSIIGSAIDQLEQVIKRNLHRHAGIWLGEHALEYVEKHVANLCQRWTVYAKLKPIAGQDAKNRDLPDQAGIQYWYAFLRDLFDAANEIREAALDYLALLPESDYPYPQHLLLGTPQEEAGFSYPNPWRSTYRAPAADNGQIVQLEKLRFLHWRLAIMIKSFYVPELEWDDTAGDSYLSVLKDINLDNARQVSGKINMPIRLTPSRALNLLLGQRAIPFYYDLADQQQSLHWYWDYPATRQNRADFQLSYHSENDLAFVKKQRGEVYAGTEKDSYTSRPAAIHPFIFDLRQYPFVRVEGLVGKFVYKREGSSDDFYFDLGTWMNPLFDVLSTGQTGVLTNLKKQYNVCFEVEVIELSEDNVITAKPLCSRCFEHLGGVYQGGKFVLLVQQIGSANNGQYKIVADFAAWSTCECGTENNTDANRTAMPFTQTAAEKSASTPITGKKSKPK
ncbi:MAG: hypothetical protein ABIQ93_12740, partial [Saprospiraceae bacterium]